MFKRYAEEFWATIEGHMARVHMDWETLDWLADYDRDCKQYDELMEFAYPCWTKGEAINYMIKHLVPLRIQVDELGHWIMTFESYPGIRIKYAETEEGEVSANPEFVFINEQEKPEKLDVSPELLRQFIHYIVE
jgi:hypothetical protein